MAGKWTGFAAVVALFLSAMAIAAAGWLVATGNSVATHESSWELTSDDLFDRIYVGDGETIVLTVLLDRAEQPRVVEIIVNGQSIKHGVLESGGAEARTFRIQDVHKVDIRLIEGTFPSGRYVISVPF